MQTELVLAALAVVVVLQAVLLVRRPRVGTGLNIGAGLTFIASGLSILALKARA